MHFAFCLYKHFPYSGLSLDMLRIANECTQRGHRATVFTGSWEGDVPDGVEVVIIKHFAMTNHTRAHTFHRKLRKHLDTHEFDVVVGFNKIPGMDIYYCGDYCYVGRSFYGIHFFTDLRRAFYIFRALNAACSKPHQRPIYCLYQTARS